MEKDAIVKFFPLIFYCFGLLCFSNIQSQQPPIWEFFPGQVGTYSTVPGGVSDMVVDYENNFHIYGAGTAYSAGYGVLDPFNGYAVISSSGRITTYDQHAGEESGGGRKFWPSLAVTPDGTVHVVERDTMGNTLTGNFNLTYKSGYSKGAWAVSYTFGEPAVHNNMVGIAAPDKENVFLAHAAGNNIMLYRATASQAVVVCELENWFSTLNSFMFRGWNGMIYLVSSDNNNIYYSWAKADSEDLFTDLEINKKTHQAGQGMRGLPQLYVAKNGEIAITYGAGMEVYFNIYGADGLPKFDKDKIIFTSETTSVSEINKFPNPAIAVSDLGDVLLAVVAHNQTPENPVLSHYYWTYSVDGGASWTQPAPLSGKTIGVPGSPVETRQAAFTYDGARKTSLAFNRGRFAVIHWDAGYFWRGSFGMIDFSAFTAAPDLGPDRSLCNFGGSLVLNSGIEEGRYQIQWFKNGVSLGPPSNSTVSLKIDTEGEYTVWAEGITFDKAHITQNTPWPTLDCCIEMQGGIATLDAGVERPEITYEWLFGSIPLDNQRITTTDFVGIHTLSLSEPGCTPIIMEIDVYAQGGECELDCTGVGTKTPIREILVIYPNPASGSDIIYVETGILAGKEVFIKVFDTTGKILGGKVLKHASSLEHLPVEYLNPGIYFVTFESDDIYLTGRFVRK